MSEPVIWEITMPGKPTQQFIPLAFHKQKLNAIQTEVERLRASSFVTAVPVEEYEKLKAEVERLRKAGDALVGEGETMAHEVSWVPYTWDNLVCDWNAAKEGKPSV